LTAGATLQIANDQTTGTEIVKMNGGSIEGFLATDSLLGVTSQGSAYRTVGSGYSFQLVGNSFLGQSVMSGANGLDNGVQATIASPTGAALTGVILELQGNISGAGSLTKQGNDTVILSGQNTYTGGTIVNQGWLRMGATNVMPSTGSLQTIGGGIYDLNGYDQTIGALTGSGFVTNTAPYLNTLTVGNGSTGDFSYGGTIQYNVNLHKVGTNTMTLTSSSILTYNGNTTIDDGTIKTGTTDNLPKTLLTVNSTGSTTGVFDMNGFNQTVGNLAGTGANAVVTSTGGAATLTAGLDNTNRTYAGTIVDGAGGTGVVSLVKQGTGTMTLTGASTYTGTTNVTAGTLLLNGTLTGTGGNINVSNSGTVFSGTGTTTRTVVVNAGAIIDAGTTTSIGTLTVGGLTLSTATSQVGVQLGSTVGVNDLINVTSAGGLTINGGQVNVSLLNGGAAAAGTYTLIDYNGALGGSGSLTLTNALIGSNNLHASLVTNVANSSIDLVLSASALRTWTGATNSNWNLTTAGNWSPANFSNGDDVLFNDTASNFNVVLNNADGPLTPNSVTFNNSANNYNLSGTGSITGATSLFKNGTGTVTISNANSYSGATQINAGMISISAANNIGDGSATNTIGIQGGGVLQSTANVDLGVNRNVTIGNGGAGFDVTSTNVLTVSGVVSGGTASDNLTKTGTGTVVLSNAGNNYGASTVVSAGTLQLGVNNAIPSGSNVSVAASATLDMNGKNDSVNGLSGVGTVTNSAAGASTLTVGFSNATADFGGTIQNGAGAVGLTKAGTGTQTMSGSSTYTGATTVNQGTLLVSGSLNGTSAVNVNNGGTLAGSGLITTGSNGNVTLALGGHLQGTAGSTLSLALGSGSLDLTAAIAPGGSQSLIFALDPSVFSAEVAVTTGTLNIGTGLLDFNDFNFTALGSFSSPGTYTLFHSNSPISGTLSANITGTIGGSQASLAISGDDVVLQVVPEPNALTLMAGSIGMALGLQRFRRRRRTA
jgi:autotransporter-associated beta strand protein